jgi:glycosyltransferase involved in cell wall biosynthesis
MERFGEELEAKISVLYNGWDERDFQQPLSNSPKQGNVVTISYIGNFYRNRTPEYFVRAIEELKAKGLFPEGLKIKFVGNYFREARSALENNTLNRSLEIVPQVNHKEAVELMREASGLLLFIATPNGKGVLTGKLFEYLRVQKPILAMIPVDGEAADLLREHGHFNICPMEDKEAIKFTFAKFIREINDNSGVYRLPEEYTRKKQTLQFLHKLKESERQ